MIIVSQNGCVVYSKTPLELPLGETVLYKIEKIIRPKGIKEDSFKERLLDVEREINTAILIKTGAGSLHPLYPHFYFDLSNKDDMDFALMSKLFNMKPVDDLGIMLYPGNEEMNKKG